MTWIQHPARTCDEHSAAGTFVGGRRVDRQLLRHGDVLRIGRTEIVFVDTR